MPRYVPGARPAVGGPTPIKLSSNENPLPPLPGVAEAIARAATEVHRYPDMFTSELTARLAAGVGLGPAQVAVGAGSVAVLGHILQAYCEPGDEVVFAWRSFEAYPILTQLVGATPVAVPLAAGARHDLPAMASAISEQTKVVLVCSPNNPTGPAVRQGEFAEFMAAVPSHVLVVLDEAYVEFVRDPDVVEGLAALAAHPNLLLLRTFSKAYGLAGLRVGYAMGAEELIAPVRACTTPFSVSSIAQTAALASLDVEAELWERVAGIVAERSRVVAALAADGWNVPDAQGNFVWLAAGDRTVELASHLADAGRPILARPFTGEGVRITIGTTDENDAMLAAVAAAPFRC